MLIVGTVLETALPSRNCQLENLICEASFISKKEVYPFFMP